MHARRALPTGSETEKAVRGLLMPCLEIEGGAVVVATANGRVSARDGQGRRFDILDVSDQLAEKYGRLYLIDHDGRDHDHPQLDYLQEIARTAEVWVDSGVRTSDQAIDVVVAGAFRTVLSTAYLRGESELRQAWKLSPEMAFEIATEASVVRASSPEFSNQAPERLAAMARSIGVRDVVYSPASGPVDWRLAGDLSRGGALWVGGVFDRDDIGRLQQSGAVGGIFSIREELGLLREGAEPTT